MTKLLATVKAIATRIIFGAHGFIAIWQVTLNKSNSIYWYLCFPIILLVFEGLFTLVIKQNQEWRWFCPSVFLYLGSVVPAIWFLELDKIERQLKFQKQATLSFSAIGNDFKQLDKLLGVSIKLPEIRVDAETWIMLIEQVLMLVLIIGRWMLPKGDLTRDQLSQLLLVYIGTAADIIEFFDSFKESDLVILTLAIWSWSLLQFTIVLSATRSRKPRGGGHALLHEEDGYCCNNNCCSIDVCGIALNIILQDAPFLAFRLLIITHYRIISYMNVFFTCKNTLVILLQLYRLYVVQSETRKSAREPMRKKKTRTKSGYSNRSGNCAKMANIYVISNEKCNQRHQKRGMFENNDDKQLELMRIAENHYRKPRKSDRKDKVYSTDSENSHPRLTDGSKLNNSRASNRKKDLKLAHDRKKQRQESSSSSTRNENYTRKPVSHQKYLKNNDETSKTSSQESIELQMVCEKRSRTYKTKTRSDSGRHRKDRDLQIGHSTESLSYAGKNNNNDNCSE